MNARIVVTTETIGDIPVLLMLPANARRCPLVFYVPGYGQGKESGLSLGYKLTQAGCAFVAFDPLSRRPHRHAANGGGRRGLDHKPSSFAKRLWQRSLGP